MLNGPSSARAPIGIGRPHRSAQVLVTTHSEGLAELLALHGPVVYELFRTFTGVTEVMEL